MTDATDWGIVVAVGWPPATDAAIRCVAAEAVLHTRPLTLAHVVSPVIVDEPDPRLLARIQRWRSYRGFVSACLCYHSQRPVAVVHDHDADLTDRPVSVGIDGSARTA